MVVEVAEVDDVVFLSQDQELVGFLEVPSVGLSVVLVLKVGLGS